MTGGITRKEAIGQEISNKYRSLLRVSKPLIKPEEQKLIRKALNLAVKLCENKKIITGKPFVIHAISVARIIAKEIGLGSTSIVCALLHDAADEPGFSGEEIEKVFGTQVVQVLNGLSNISGIDTRKTSLQTENFRRLLLNLASDFRVILIKLAERLEYMRNLKNVNRELRIIIASETYYLYAPLAHRLGLFNIKSELEDLSMKYTEPKKYQYIVRKLQETTTSRNKFIREFSNPLRKNLEKTGTDFTIIGRTKSIHSIWIKMKKQNIEFEEIYDLFAIRIILRSKPEREKADCWQAYSYVTDLYQPNPQRLRDWISVPKTNGYESLHTTVVGPGGRWVEVQIRSERMNEIAEKGYAAHWRYKGITVETGLDDWLAKMRENLKVQEPETPDFMEQVKLNLYSDEVFVFTPKGDLKQLPANSSVLDFAFDIHTEIGSTCVGGKVNNKNVSIRCVLHNGDQVEVITSKNQKPKSDWLNFVVTSKAKSKIKLALNEERFREAEAGKEIMKRRFRNWKIAFNDENIKNLLKHLKFRTSQDLYSKVGKEMIDMGEIKDFLTKKKDQANGMPEESPEEPALKEIVSHDPRYDDFLVIDNNVENLYYKLAKCCNPILGDDIFGFVTINEGVKIHRINCPNSPQLLSKYPYRILKARWTRTDGRTSFHANVRISGIDDVGIVHRISDVISRDLKVNMRSFSIESNEGLFEGTMKVLVTDTKHLNVLLRKLLRVKGVLKAARFDEPITDS